jgi:hypothetical protein
VTAAIFGLIGVVVGGLITGGVDFLLERRREGAEHKQAKRLVGDEIDSIVTGLDLIVENARLPRRGLSDEERMQFLPVGEWFQHKAALALALSDDEWRFLSTFYYNVGGFRARAIDLGPGAEVDDDTIDLVRRDIAIGREAMKRLGLADVPPASRGPPPAHPARSRRRRRRRRLVYRPRHHCGLRPWRRMRRCSARASA